MRRIAAIIALTIGGAVLPFPIDSPTVTAAQSGTLGMRPSGGFLKSERLEQFEADLSRPIDWYVGMAGRASVKDMKGSVHGQVRNETAVLPGLSDRLNLVMTVPLAFGTGSARTEDGRAAIRTKLLETASGAWDADYRTVARALISGGYPDAIIRLGHEFTGGWYPWSAQGNADAYVAAFRHVHGVFAEESASFRFEWNAARNSFIEHGPPAYPGDEYVDIVGMDVYYEPWKGDPEELTDDVWQRRYRRVLAAHQEFARSHGKPVSYAEWANGGVDEPQFVELMHSWFAALPEDGPGSLLYQSYFNVNNDLYNLDRYPLSKQRYLELFGAGADDNSPPSSVAPSSVPPSSGAVEPPVSSGPAVSVGGPYAVVVGESLVVDATVDASSVRWWKLDGPGPIAWSTRTAEDPQVRFSVPGRYVLKAKAVTGDSYATAKVEIQVAPATSPSDPSSASGPAISVGGPYTVVVGESLVVDATVDASSVRWWKLDGPGPIAWSTRTAEDPQVRFSVPGRYVLKAKAVTGDSHATAKVQITVTR